jgi:Uma2 family endonuclease
VRTLLPDPPPAPFDELIERRRRIGADKHDEVWEGVLHMAPAPRDVHSLVQHEVAVLLHGPARVAGLFPGLELNLGEEGNYRVPDGGLHRTRSWGVYAPSVELAFEVVSPGDETWEKLGFYASHGVEELLIVDPARGRVDWLGLEDGEYRAIERSGLIELGAARAAELIDWPPEAGG